MKKKVLIFSIFFAYIFGFYFLCLDKVNAAYYTKDDVTYDYEYFKNLILENNNVNLDNYEHVIIQTDNNVSSNIIYSTLLFWNNSDYEVSYLNDQAKKIKLKNFDEAYFCAVYLRNGNLSLWNLKDKGSNTQWQEDGKNEGFSVYHDTWINENNSLTRYKSSTKGLNYIEFEGVKYYFDKILADEQTIDKTIGIDIINKLSNITKIFCDNMQNNNIKFEFVLIGMFLFNFLIYVICYVIRRFF